MKQALPSFILASASPRRIDLLNTLGILFSVAPSSIDETPQANELPIAYVQRLALEKAQFQAQSPTHQPPFFILGADTSVILGNTILGKPKDRQEAITMLSLLAGQTHQVLTGYALMQNPDKVITCQVEESLVTLKPLTQTEIEAYIQTGEPMDKAGAYAAQGLGKKLIQKIEGLESNVIGLPIERLVPWFKQFGLMS